MDCLFYRVYLIMYLEVVMKRFLIVFAEVVYVLRIIRAGSMSDGCDIWKDYIGV